MRALVIYLNRTRVGVLSEGDDLWTFEYDAAWSQAPEGFDLAPALRRTQPRHTDGGTHRPVQWYFDNLLPEEKLRDMVSKEAGLKGDDAFALLEYLGAESTGSLVLLPPDEALPDAGGTRPLTDAALSQRIRDLPRVSLSNGAPKRMSMAGAQNKLPVVYRGGALFEAVGAEPSTHILKPDHLSDDYPASVINEYVVMRLAGRLGLDAPKVHRRYVPEPVYIVERFDRHADADGHTQRRHIIDACQLLGKARVFKDKAATLDTLAQCIALCSNRINARLRLYRWLVFNVLIANDDTHLKNISFSVGRQGIDLCPPYDLLSTGTYHTRAFADDRALWPDVTMMIPLPGGATRFGDVSRAAMLDAGKTLGLPAPIAERELDRMTKNLPAELAALVAEIETDTAVYPAAARRHMAGELRLVRAIQHAVVPDMLRRLSN